MLITVHCQFQPNDTTTHQQFMLKNTKLQAYHNVSPPHHSKAQILISIKSLLHFFLKTSHKDSEVL